MSKQSELASTAAALLKARTKYAAAQKKADEAKKALAALEAQMLDELAAAHITSVRVRGFNFTPGWREIIETYDWDAYRSWARKDPLGVYVERRPAKKAVYEQLDAGTEVPGVRPGKVPVLYVTRASN
jgi:hypothetical protein